jgi:hypothetical protein
VTTCKENLLAGSIYLLSIKGEINIKNNYGSK